MLCDENNTFINYNHQKLHSPHPPKKRRKGVKNKSPHVLFMLSSVMCQLPIELNYRKSHANYRHIVYVWSTDKFTERGRAISGRSIEAYPSVFDFAHFLDSEALSKAIYHSLGCK